VNLDDLDARNLAIAVLSVDSQKRSEIFRQWTLIVCMTEFLKGMVGMVRTQNACVVAQNVVKSRIAIVADVLKPS
jgi:uncharacterized protein YaaW (UPF0174 family)